MAEISIHLFSKPESEINLEEAEPEDFKRLGNDLQKRLARVGDIVEKLESSGWKRSEGIYDLNFHKEIKPNDAKKEMKELGIELSEIGLIEEENY